jgi:hypothetical protein
MRDPVLLVLLASCGGIAYEDYEAETRDATCDYRVRCKALANASDCHAHLDELAIDSPSLPAAIAEGTVRYDEDAAQQCVDALASLSCDVTEQTGALAACDDVYEGTRDDGDACGFDLECKSGSCATLPCSEACCPGMCRPAVPLPGLDDACSIFCVDGAYCGVDSICHAYLPKGAACDATTICTSDLYCAGASQGGSGVCTAIPHDGEPCEGPCTEYGSGCLANICQPLGLAGDPCDNDAECSPFYACNSDNRCDRYPGVGMTCLGRCSGAAYCDNAICVEQKPSGSTCTYNVECATHFCGNDDVCGDPPLCI